MAVSLTKYIEKIGGENLTNSIDTDGIELTGGYVSDLLSDVMGSAQDNQLWITIMKHLNVIAVASLANIPCICFAKGVRPDEPIIQKANEEGICLITSDKTTYELAGMLYLMLQGTK